MAKTKTSHAVVKEHADYLASLMRPHCERLEIAGSLRRGKQEVGDIEFVVLPRTTPVQDMFGEVVDYASHLGPALDRWRWPCTKAGPLYRQYQIEDRQVDIFICTAETWAVNLLLRTGSAAFSRRFVTDRRHGGMLPPGYKVKGARLLKHDNPLPIYEEAELFEELGQPWIPPEQREE